MSRLTGLRIGSMRKRGQSSSSANNPGAMGEGLPGGSSDQPLPVEQESAFRYIWLGCGQDILLPFKIQGPISCSFASTARQVEYDIKMKYAKEGMFANVSFDHCTWEVLVRHKYQDVPIFNPLTLMELMMKEELVNQHPRLTMKERDTGVPLVVTGSNMPYRCYSVLSKDHPSAQEISDLLRYRKLPLVAVLPLIPDEYPTFCEKPFTNRRNLTRSQQVEAANSMTHAVDLVGIYDTSLEGNPLNLDPSKTWFIFQSSVLEKDVEQTIQRSILPQAMSVVCSTLVLHISATINLPGSEFVHRNPQQYNGNLIEKQMVEEMFQKQVFERRVINVGLSAIAANENAAFEGMMNLRLD